MKRIGLIVLALAGGFAIGFATAFTLIVSMASIAWLFVFGDDQWPTWAELVIGQGNVLIGIVVGLYAAVWIYRRGKRRL